MRVAVALAAQWSDLLQSIFAPFLAEAVEGVACDDDAGDGRGQRQVLQGGRERGRREYIAECEWWALLSPPLLLMQCSAVQCWVCDCWLSDVSGAEVLQELRR